MKKTHILFLFLTVAMLTSCHPKPKLAYLVPDTQGPAGYKARGSESVFENKALLASAKQVRKNEISNPFLASLLEKDFVVISMTIENRSALKAIYKPNYTALINAIDYLKPLDYTDLYELGGEAADTLKGKFYDLDTVIPPGRSSTGLLIFTPVSKEAKKAAVRISDLYVGTETLTFSLPFKMTATPY
jgi:hypothetical protein